METRAQGGRSAALRPSGSYGFLLVSEPVVLEPVSVPVEEPPLPVEDPVDDPPVVPVLEPAPIPLLPEVSEPLLPVPLLPVVLPLLPMPLPVLPVVLPALPAASAGITSMTSALRTAPVPGAA
jgi:hypothetical protein